MSTALAAPAGENLHSHPTTEAMIICSALAWKGNPLAGLHMQTNVAQRLVTAARVQHDTQEILNWRAHTDPGTWEFRWDSARRATHHHFPDVIGLRVLPHSHEDLPRV